MVNGKPTIVWGNKKKGIIAPPSSPLPHPSVRSGLLQKLSCRGTCSSWIWKINSSFSISKIYCSY